MLRAGRVRMIGLVMAALGLVGLAFSLPFMVSRLSSRDLPVVWFNKSVAANNFEFQRQPAAIHTIDAATPDANPTLEIAWRGQVREFEIEPGMRDDPRLPGLLRHADWLRVLVMAEGARSETELDAAVKAGDIQPRLIIAMRMPPKDYQTGGSWAEVRRRESRYRFIELANESASSEPFIITEATYAELDKLGNPAFRKEAGRENEVWKYYAMQQVTPSLLVRSKSRPIEDAMNALGWTWPVAGLSMVLIVGGLVLAAASGSERE